MLHPDTFSGFSPFKLGDTGYAGRLGRDPDDDDEPKPGPKAPPIWKQIAVMVGISGLTAFFETFAREAAHRLWRRAGGSLDETEGESGKEHTNYVLVPVEADDGEDDDTDPGVNTDKAGEKR